jgi:cytochrome c-type biogenesis protein CcmF
VRWVWLGSIFMALGGFVAITDKRYRRFRVKKASILETAPTPVLQS